MKTNFLLKWITIALTVFAVVGTSQPVFAADYQIDADHSFVEFRIQHLGFSWLHGRFNKISGNFSYSAAKPGSNKIYVEIDTGSVDTHHAKRDKHLRSDDFLDVKKFPKATFKSTKFNTNGESGTVKGVLTLHGVSKAIIIDVSKVGEGSDPWGGYRAGFEGKVTLKRRDFGISHNLGPASETMEFMLGIEGIRK